MHCLITYLTLALLSFPYCIKHFSSNTGIMYKITISPPLTIFLSNSTPQGEILNNSLMCIQTGFSVVLFSKKFKVSSQN